VATQPGDRPAGESVAAGRCKCLGGAEKVRPTAPSYVGRDARTSLLGSEKTKLATLFRAVKSWLQVPLGTQCSELCWLSPVWRIVWYCSVKILAIDHNQVAGD